MLKLRDKNRLEIIKWTAVFVLLSLDVIGSYCYRDVMPLLRIVTMFIIFVAAVGIMLSTKEGKAVRVFTREARIEIRKVIWPTFQETLYTTLIVVVVTAISSLILWGLDGILVHIVSFITGKRL